jgi:hypothetical protein
VTRRRLTLLLGLYLWFLGACAASLPEPEQPSAAAPHALIQLSAAAKLLAVDEQQFDTRMRIRTLRVSPGQHTLRFVHVAAGPDGSTAHAGQHASPFILHTEAGMTYQFEAKT